MTERANQRILCISGPNLQLLGTREPAVYGRETLSEIHVRLQARALSLQVEIDARQTNHEGTILDWIGGAALDGLVRVLRRSHG
jgi:3-dehydroquinate dehydratase-2